jgi:ELWxxDGT repeat protein
LFFSANDGTNGEELWKSDGTVGGTELVKDIVSGASSSQPSDLTASGTNFLFTANDSINGRELWTTDGTEAGTSLLLDLNPGSASSTSNRGLMAVVTPTNIFFAADNGQTGLELWRYSFVSSESGAAPVASRPYEGPLNVATEQGAKCAGGEVLITGQRLETIQGVEIDGKSTSFKLLENGSLSYSLAGFKPGKYDVRLSVPASSLVLTSSITVQACDSVIEPTGTGKVNVGSFNGKLVVYALGLDRARITWKVSGIWGQDFAAGNTLNRFDRLTPLKGVTVKVDIFVDGVKRLTKSVLTR